MSRVVVIGAGVGGLSAAIRLAAAGHDVEVHERSAVVGGKLATYERDGFRFDTGPSLITLPQVFAGLDLPLVELDPVVRHVFPGGTVLDSSATHEVFLDRIRATLGAGAAADWHRFWRRAERIWRASWRSVLRRPVTPASLAGLAWRLPDLAAIAPGRSLRGLGFHYLRDPRLRMLLERYATYTGADPRHAPAALAAIPYAELNFGGWYLRGGLAELGTALTARCAELGVRIVLNSPVTSIATDGNRVRGVHIAGGTRPTDVRPADVRGADVQGANVRPANVRGADVRPANVRGADVRGADVRPANVRGADVRPVDVRPVDVRPASVSGAGVSGADVVPADVVVSDVDALTLYRELLPTPGRLARLADRSLAGFVLLLGVRGDTPSLAHHTVFFPTWYDAEFDAIFGSAARRAKPASDPTVFITRATDPAVHLPGDEAWFVLVNAPRHGTGWHEVDWRRPGLADAYARHILDVLARRGLDVRDRLSFMETRTPADLADAAGAPGGAIYGTAGGLLRPANRGPIDGLYLVGGSVHPGGGLPMVTLSAQIVADQIGPAQPR
jgi:phytoene dehydrogenase-like protein